jgi:hypothetical protein
MPSAGLLRIAINLEAAGVVDAFASMIGQVRAMGMTMEEFSRTMNSMNVGDGKPHQHPLPGPAPQPVAWGARAIRLRPAEEEQHG